MLVAIVVVVQGRTLRGGGGEGGGGRGRDDAHKRSLATNQNYRLSLRSLPYV